VTPFSFNATGIPPASADGSSSLPVGEHPVTITGGEFKAVKDKPNAGMLVLTLTVYDGPNKGASGPWRLNLYSDSPQAVEIAQKQMSALCHVTNTFIVNNVEDLFGKPFLVCVGPQANNPQYTQVNGVKFLDGRDPGKPGAAPQQQAPQQQMPPGGFGQPGGQPTQFQQPQGQPAFGQPQQQQPQGGSFGQGGFAPQQQPQAPQGNGWAPAPAAPQQPAQQQAPAAGGWAPQGQQPPQGGAQGGAPQGWGGGQQQAPAGGQQPWAPGR